MKTFAFVFPGQGSQAVGMLNGWGDHSAVVQTLQEASDALGEDIARLIQDGPKEALALDCAVRSGQVKPGETLLLEGVGGGFTWGAVLLKL